MKLCSLWPMSTRQTECLISFGVIASIVLR